MPHSNPRVVVRLLLALTLAASHAGAALAAPESPPGDPVAPAANPAAPANVDTSFDALVARVRRGATDDAKLEDWQDGAIDVALAQLVSQVRDAAKNDAFELPVELADMQDVTTEPRPQRLRPGTLWVSRGGTADHATRNVILADGSVEIGFATQCVIIARGAVDISHGNGNVVVAGHFVQVAHDGNRGPGARRPPGFAPPGAAAPPGPPPTDGSILVSGGPIVVSHATGTVCSSPRLVDVGFATGVTFLNSPNVEAGRTEACQAVQAADLALAPPEKANPLEGKLKVTQIVSNGRQDRRFVLVDDNGVERVVRPGEPVRDAAGQPVAALAGWKLTFVGDRIAVFSNGTEDATFYIESN